MSERTKTRMERIAPVLGRNTTQVNEVMANILLACTPVIILLTGLSMVGFFEFGRTYSEVLLFVGLFVCLTPRVFIHLLPADFMKYYMMISVAVFIGVIGADRNIGVYITYVLVPVLSCLYFEPMFVAKTSIFSYFMMLLSVYAASADMLEVLYQRRPRMQMFLAYAAGFTIEYIIVMAVLFYLVRRAQNLVAECSNAESENEAKTTFLLNMSHDIRTPMNAILGYCALMHGRIENPELQRYQEMIEQSGNLLLSIINNVLDMAHIESGKMELDENVSRTEDIVRGVCSMFEMEAKKKDIELECNVQIKHDYIICDSTKVQEILANIISNAVKYTPAGGKVTVTSWEISCERNGYINLQTIVEDTGIGMSMEFLPHLFDSFTRERDTTNAKVLGAGLGMAIVKSLVDLMGGSVEVESELGKGTRFVVTTCHKIVDAKYYEQSKLTVSEGERLFSGKRILLAEDNELNAEIATVILGDMGFLIDRVEDGICCVDRLEKSAVGTYDLILMDVQMPNMDGYKATKIIRSLPDKQKAQIPIIAMTANAFAEDRKKAFELGMNGHIAKPIDALKIKETLVSIFV